MKKLVFCLTLLGLIQSNAAFSEQASSVGSVSTRNRIKIRKKSQIQRSTQDESKEYSLEKMELLMAKRRGLILDIKRFLRESTSADQKAELNLRLGALYMEDYQGSMAKAQQVFETQVIAWEKDTSKKKRPKPKLDSTEAIASLDRARAVYRDLLKLYPTHQRRDEIFYFLAISSFDKGLQEEGIGYFRMLSEQTPNSRYLNDALVQLGDFYFDSNKFPEAEQYYNKLIARKHKPLLAYATYKKGWCAYNAGKHQVALNLFKWVVQYEDSMPEENHASVKTKNEAMKDITLPFVDLKLVDESVDFFRAAGDPYTRNGIETMASLYYEAGDYNHAVQLYENLLAMDANHKKNPNYDINIIEAYRLKREDKQAVARLFARLPNYLENSNWYEINSSSPQVIKEASTQFEESAWRYGTQYHAEAQRTKSLELYDISRQLYEKYLEYFPHNVRAAKVRFQLAEILYKQSRYIAAADQYYTVYKDSAAGELKLDAIRNALMSLDRELNLDRKKLGLAEVTSKLNTKLTAKENEVLELVPYTEVETKFLKIGDEYLTAFPNQKDAADVLYENSYLQYVHHDFVPSYKNFWNLIQKYPKHETAYPSAHLILDILNRRQDYDRLVQAAKKFLETATFNRPKFRTDVAAILRQGELKRIQTVEEKGEYKLAADAYIEYTKEYGPQDDSLFEKALYNASVNFTRAEAHVTAVETQEKFLRRFPKSALKENMLLQVAKTYELLANFEKAGAYYEQFVQAYPRNEQAKYAMRLAGIYYWGSGNARKAESILIDAISRYPSDRKSLERDLLDLWETEGSSEKLARFYLNARAQKGLPAADYVAYTLKVAEVGAQRSGQMSNRLMEEALKTANYFSKDMLTTPKGVEAISKIWFWYVGKKEDTFYKIRLALPQRTLEINLQRKLALLKELENDYAKVTSFGSAEWGLASLYRTAQAYRTMAQDVLQAPVPAELSAEQLELYRSEIEKTFIKPFNEKAFALATQCMDKSQEFNLLSRWTAKCYSLAGETEPARYPIVRTFYLQPQQLSVMLPKKSNSKVELGSVKNYSYPFFSAGLFSPTPPTRVVAAVDPSLLYGELRGLGDEPGSAPMSLSYITLIDERKEILNGALKSERPADTRKSTSFAFLNLLRLVSAQRAIPLIREAIQRDPENAALHNLLGLTYLEMGNTTTAKVIWSAMAARGIKNAALWNNLGVLAYLEGKEATAIEYFNEATLLEEPRDALANLGFIALKYRNGFEAKKHFEKAVALEKNEITSQVGLAVSRLQNRELDSAKDGLIELTRKYKTDPYAKISLAYFLVDIEKENEIANRILGEYIEQQDIDSDLTFRQAMQETLKRGSANTGDSLPDIQ